MMMHLKLLMSINYPTHIQSLNIAFNIKRNKWRKFRNKIENKIMLSNFTIIYFKFKKSQ